MEKSQIATALLSALLSNEKGYEYLREESAAKHDIFDFVKEASIFIADLDLMQDPEVQSIRELLEERMAVTR